MSSPTEGRGDSAGAPYAGGAFGSGPYGGVVGSLFDRVNSVADLEGLIRREVRQSETIEYKAAHDRIPPDEVAKDVSAFANSSGGTIIYGIVTEKPDKTKPVRVASILPDNIEAIQIAIASHIRQPIPGVRPKIISDDSQRPVALLIDVPASPLAPHQALGQYRYYRRDGPRSAPMPHDLVELYFRRRLGPILEPRYRIELQSPITTQPGWEGTFKLEFSAENIGPRTARDVWLRLRFPIADAYLSHGFPNFAPAQAKQTETEWSITLPVGVLHPELQSDSITIEFSVRPYIVEDTWPLLGIGIYADEMRPVRRKLGILYFDRDDHYEIKQEDTATDLPLDLNTMPPWVAVRQIIRALRPERVRE